MKERIRRAFERRVWMGWVVAPAILLLIAGGMFLASKAEASESDGWFSRPPYVYLGLEHDRGVACFRDAVNPLRANMGFGVNLWAHRGLEVNLQYTHHSCAFDRDQVIQDTGGVMIKWYPTK